MRVLPALLVVATLATTSRPVAAQNVTLTGSGTVTSLFGGPSLGAVDFSFLFPQSPTPDVELQGFLFDLINVNGVFKQGASTFNVPGNLEFYVSGINGGFSFFANNQSAISVFGAQLFSGTTSAPMFLTGTYAASNFSTVTTVTSFTIASATATDSTVPEPSTWILMATGLVGVAAFARRKRSA